MNSPFQILFSIVNDVLGTEALNGIVPVLLCRQQCGQNLSASIFDHVVGRVNDFTDSIGGIIPNFLSVFQSDLIGEVVNGFFTVDDSVLRVFNGRVDGFQGGI